MEVTSSSRFLLLFFRTEAQAHGSRLGQAYRPTPVRLCLTQLHNHNGLLRTPPPPDLARCKCNAIGPDARACAGGRPAERGCEEGQRGLHPTLSPCAARPTVGGHGLLRASLFRFEDRRRKELIGTKGFVALKVVEYQ